MGNKKAPPTDAPDEPTLVEDEGENFIVFFPESSGFRTRHLINKKFPWRLKWRPFNGPNGNNYIEIAKYLTLSR